MRHLIFSLITLMFSWCVGSVVGAEEDSALTPTPFATPEAAVAHAEQYTRTAQAADPVDGDIVGAVTKGKDGKLRFMPLLQHHHAREHWFVEGIDETKLTEAFADTNICFVRVRGKLTSLGIFGGEGIEWFGNGISHSEGMMEVRGWHVRVYRFVVSELVWARSSEVNLKHTTEAYALMQPIKSLFELQEYTTALDLCNKAVTAAQDTGINTRLGLDRDREYADMMVHLTSDPKTWTEKDLDRVAQSIVGIPERPYDELGDEKAPVRLQELIKTWPKSTHEALGSRVANNYSKIEYRHIREKLLLALKAIDSDAIRALDASVQDAEKKFNDLTAKLKQLQTTDDYKGMLSLAEEIAPYLSTVRNDHLFEHNLSFWKDAASRLLAVQEAFEDPDQRMKVMLKKVQESIMGESGAANSSVKPRFNEEIINRFVPRLSVDEKAALEAALLDVLESLKFYDQKRGNLDSDLIKIYIAAELLASVAGEKGRAKIRDLKEEAPRNWKGEINKILRELQ